VLLKNTSGESTVEYPLGLLPTVSSLKSISIADASGARNARPLRSADA
jgi:hypothetical protein